MTNQPSDRSSKRSSKSAKRFLVKVPAKRPISPNNASQGFLQRRNELRMKRDRDAIASVTVSRVGNELLVVAPDRYAIEIWYMQCLQNHCPEGCGLEANIWYRESGSLKRFCVFTWI